MSVTTQVSAFFLVVIFVIALSALFAWPLMLLWNGCLVGTIAGVGEVTWLQMWGITVLFSFLFKSSYTATKD